MPRALADGGSRPTMFQMTPGMIARLDHIAAKLVLNRSALVRGFCEERLAELEKIHGSAPLGHPSYQTSSMLPPSVGPARLDNDREFWVSFNGEVNKLRESVIIERYLIPKVVGVYVAPMGSQEWKSPEEYGIKIPSTVAPPPYVPAQKPEEVPPPPFIPKAVGPVLPPQAPNAPPAFVPTPPSPPKIERKFFVSTGSGDVRKVSESELSDIIKANPNTLVCLEGETAWKMASDYGLISTPKLDGAANGNGMESRSGTPTLI